MDVQPRMALHHFRLPPALLLVRADVEVEAMNDDPWNEHDHAVMSAGIGLSSFLEPFLKQNERKLDTLAEIDAINAYQLESLREAQRRMVEARIARVTAARQETP
jgi:hypothetical protein